MQSPIQAYLEGLHSRLAGIRSGELASYIPELTKADPAWFGICLVTMDGTVYSTGDTDEIFTIQSISKAFVYGTALADRGLDFVSRKVGVEPSGDAFNSISLDPQTGAPINPMINAGAIATTSMVSGESPEAQWARIEDSISTFVGRKVNIDESVYRSESATGFRNRAIAWMLKNFGIIDGEPMASLENYFRQCSIEVNCRDLGFMAATLANGGVHPLTGKRALPAEHVERVLSVMATCGMYDYAGSWLYEIGLPAKSGVGGGIIAVLPGRFGIAIFSPLLDEKGNSVRGIEACKHLSRDFNLHVFTPAGDPRMTLGRLYTGADAPSRRQTTGDTRAWLSANAHRIKYLCLHGFLGVDGIEYVIRRMIELAAETHSFILDMNQVDGMSESAATLLHQARLGLMDDGIAVVCSRIRDGSPVKERLRKTTRSGDRGVLHFEDNDLAVEWCENRLIGEASCSAMAHRPLADSLLFAGMPEPLMKKVHAVAYPQQFAAGAQILKVGEACDGRVYFIESGQISVLVPTEDGKHQRISSLGPGMNFGEMVLLGQKTRTATVYADSDVRCSVLEVRDFDRISAATPEFRSVILENLARDLADKLRRSTQCVSALA
ncbi:glutaminase A [Methyloversatilis sp. XJ19-49]|uniref:glutaminase A n=1 Tax=Methyloversatilis sp. XJ19-49 TaxID=2963429 RepID=UPI00211B9509|nr:glutaminase A [Methyloversatilis sp. XJ19-49]MCQ9378061.1 glutaminase A [Methyloversatilis sp. XJ19-49]